MLFRSFNFWNIQPESIILDSITGHWLVHIVDDTDTIVGVLNSVVTVEYLKLYVFFCITRRVLLLFLYFFI